METKKEKEETTLHMLFEAIQDLGKELRSEMKTMGDELRGEMKTMEGGLRDEMKTMEGGLRDEMKTIKGEVKTMGGEIDNLAMMTQREFEKAQRERDELREEIKEKFDLTLYGQDNAVKRMEDSEMENTMGGHRQDERLDDHERRIGTVEKKLNVAAPAV